MKIQVTPYQHFKGGNYLVYGDIHPLPDGLLIEEFSFIAKEAENATDVDVIVTKEGIFYMPFSDEAMTLYCSEETGQWWLRPSEEFHGDKIHGDGIQVKRFTLRQAEESQSITLQSSE